MSRIGFRLSSNTLALVVATIGFAAISMPALAEVHVLSGTHSKDDIKGACDKVGGISNEGAGGQGYGCYNPKNGTMVACANSGVCTGYTPGRIMVPTKLHYLLNLAIPAANNFAADSSPAGNGISKGGAALANPGQVVVIY